MDSTFHSKYPLNAAVVVFALAGGAGVVPFPSQATNETQALAAIGSAHPVARLPQLEPLSETLQMPADLQMSRTLQTVHLQLPVNVLAQHTAPGAAPIAPSAVPSFARPSAPPPAPSAAARPAPARITAARPTLGAAGQLDRQFISLSASGEHNAVMRYTLPPPRPALLPSAAISAAPRGEEPAGLTVLASSEPSQDDMSGDAAPLRAMPTANLAAQDPQPLSLASAEKEANPLGAAVTDPVTAPRTAAATGPAPTAATLAPAPIARTAKLSAAPIHPALAGASATRRSLAQLAAPVSAPKARPAAKPSANLAAPAKAAAAIGSRQYTLTGDNIEFAMPFEANGALSGSIPVRIAPDQSISLKLKDLLSQFAGKMDAQLYAALSASSHADEFVTFRLIRSAGIDVRYDAAKDRLILGAGE